MQSFLNGTAAVSVVVDRIVVAIATTITVAALAALFLALMAEVVVRYLTTQGLGWPSETPALLFPWLTMGGAVLAAQLGRHIAVTVVAERLPIPVARAGIVALHALIAATFLYLAYVGLQVLKIAGGEIYPMTGLAAVWPYSALVGGFLLLALTALTGLPEVLLSEDPAKVDYDEEHPT